MRRSFQLFLATSLILGFTDLALSEQQGIRLASASTISSQVIAASEIIKQFEILLKAPPGNSQEYLSVLSWVVKAENRSFSMSLSEANKVKESIDQWLEKNLTYENVSMFHNRMQQVGLVNIYNMIPAAGRLYDKLSLIEGRMEASQLTEQDLKIIKKVLSQDGLNLNKLQSFMKPLSEFVPDGMLYNGFPSMHLPNILSSGLRSGLAYGPPGSVQIEGIFTTSKKQSSINWGLVKSQSFGAMGENMNAHLLAIQISPQEMVLDLPFESGDLKSKLLRVGAGLGLQSVYKKLSPNAQHLINRDAGKSLKFSIILAALGAKLYRTTIYMDAGRPMGKEIVIADRRAIKKSYIENADGQPVSQSDLQKIRDMQEQQRIKFSEQLDYLLRSSQIKEAIKLFTQSNIYFVDTPARMSLALKRLSSENKIQFLEALIEDYRYKNFSLVAKEFLDNKSLLENPKTREAFHYYFQIRFNNNGGFYQLKYETLQEQGFAQRFVREYLNFIADRFPDELAELVKITKFPYELQRVTNKCSVFYF